MHELAIAGGILDVATAALSGVSTAVPRVSKVTVRIGRLTNVVPESLRYHFELLTTGTPFEGAALDIVKVPIQGSCSDCSSCFEIDIPSFGCPRCGSGFVRILSGRELEVVSLETVEDAPAHRQETCNEN